MFDILVVGGGPAGVTAALRASELGAKVALVERNRLGGTCSNDGCVPTRVLAHAARLVGERPVLDFGALMKRTQEKIYSLHEKKQLIHHLQEAGVETYISVGEAQ